MMNRYAVEEIALASGKCAEWCYMHGMGVVQDLSDYHVYPIREADSGTDTVSDEKAREIGYQCQETNDLLDWIMAHPCTPQQETEPQPPVLQPHIKYRLRNGYSAYLETYAPGLIGGMFWYGRIWSSVRGEHSTSSAWFADGRDHEGYRPWDIVGIWEEGNR